MKINPDWLKATHRLDFDPAPSVNIGPAPLQLFPWDTIAHWCPTWAEIRGKAHHYKTARRQSDGKHVALIGVSLYANGRKLEEPVFLVREEKQITAMATGQLCAFCL